MKKLMMAVVVLFVALVVASPGWAVPQKINFQGVFKKGAPTGSQTVVFRINGWTESYTASELNIDEKGFFSVQLGAKTALSLPEYAVVTVEVNGTALPGQALTSAPYAITAGHVISRNPNNDNASVSLGWWNDVARIRTGGTGTGAGNGLDIQGYSDLSKLRVTNVGVGVMTPEVTTGYECDVNGDLLVRGNMNVLGAITGVTSSPAFSISNDPEYFYIGKSWSGVFERISGAGTPTFTWTVSIEPSVTGINPSAVAWNTPTTRATLNGTVSTSATEGWKKLTVRMKDYYNQVAIMEKNIMCKKQPVTLHKVIDVSKTSAGITDFEVGLTASGGVLDYTWYLTGTVTAKHQPPAGEFSILPMASVAVTDVAFNSVTGRVGFTTMVPSTGATVVSVPVRVKDQINVTDEGTVKITISKGSLKLDIPEFMTSVEKIDPSGPVTDPGDPVGSDVEDRISLAEHVMGMSGNAAADWVYTSPSGVTTTYRMKAGSNLQKLATNMNKVQNLSGDFLTTVALDGYAKSDMSNVAAIPANKVSGTLSLSQVVPSVTALPAAGAGFGVANGYGTMLNLTTAAGGYDAGTYQNQYGGSWHKIATAGDLTFAKLQTSAGLGAMAQKSSLIAGDIPALDASKITTGTLADARIVGTIARDSEIATLATSAGFATQSWANGQFLNTTGTANQLLKSNVIFRSQTSGGAVPGIFFTDDPTAATANAAFGYVPSSGVTGLYVKTPGTTNWGWAFQANNSTKAVSMSTLKATNIQSVNALSTIASFTFVGTLSDMRLKSDITPVSGALGKVAAINGVSYKWKDAAAKGLPATTQLGLIAQDVEKVAPELVSDTADGYKSLNYNGMSALFVEAIKELKAENETLKARIKALEDKSAK